MLVLILDCCNTLNRPRWRVLHLGNDMIGRFTKDLTSLETSVRPRDDDVASTMFNSGVAQVESPHQSAANDVSRHGKRIG